MAHLFPRRWPAFVGNPPDVLGAIWVIMAHSTPCLASKCAASLVRKPFKNGRFYAAFRYFMILRPAVAELPQMSSYLRGGPRPVPASLTSLDFSGLERFEGGRQNLIGAVGQTARCDAHSLVRQ